MRTNSEIVDLIKTLCEEKEMSLSELARQVGMAKSAISRYFSKQRQFPLNKISIFAGVLNVTPEYLLGLDNTNSNKIKKVSIEYNHIPKQDTAEITNIYTKLKPQRQKIVLDTATTQLKEQQAEENKNKRKY